MHYNKLLVTDTMNGPGVRVTLFVSGCTLNCPGCFNKAARNFKFGQEFKLETANKIIEYLREDFIEGLSILGGDPLEPKHADEIISLCKYVRIYAPGKTIWLWSGRTLEEIQRNEKLSPILDIIDVLVDGRFVRALKDDSLEYCGSSNQRVIYLRKENESEKT